MEMSWSQIKTEELIEPKVTMVTKASVAMTSVAYNLISD